MTKRVAVYARVSTLRQAVNDISVPDQLQQAVAYCRTRGWTVVREYIEAGASARDDRRPVFRRMIEDASIDPSPYDLILVHSQSRFYRDAIQQGLYRRQLETFGVLVHSMTTQDFGEGPQAELVQTIIAAADAHNSAETAKHVKRSMKENARQGFWNGARPPLGYRTYVAEQRGEKAKKKLEIEPKGAALVRLIYRLFLEGDGGSGPMGVKQLTDYLNSRAYRTTTGGLFYISMVHKILTNSAYMGVHYYNRRDSRTGKPRPREEWVALETPVIIEPEIYQSVQVRLQERSPQKIAPRLVTSSVLLSGLAHCQACGQRLMMTTGKSGRYRYYACSSKFLKGGCACECPIRVPEGQLDERVLSAVSGYLFVPERVKMLVQQASRLAKERSGGASEDLKSLRRELRAIDAKVDRLFDALTDGTISDSKGFRDHLAKLEARRDELIRLIAIKERDLALPVARLSDSQIARFSEGLQTLLAKGPPAFRKDYLKLLVDRIEVGKAEIRICGSKMALAVAVQAAKKGGAGTVPSFVREWRTRQDSNL